MKKLGTEQFDAKKYKEIHLPGELGRFIGELVYGFRMLIVGSSGSGKTEFAQQLMKLLVKFGRAMWLSYEQQHDKDLQKAMRRNKQDDWNGQVIWADPWEDVPDPSSVAVR